MRSLADKVVLLVEDDEADVELARRAFEHYGFDARVETALDGAHALERLRGGLEADLIVADIKMPRLSGLDLQQRLREDPALAALPVVILTSSAESADRARAAAQGARAFLRKPMQLDEWKPVVEVLAGALD